MNTPQPFLKSAFSSLPGTVKLILGILALNLVFFSVLRFGFWLLFSNPDDAVSALTLLKSFYIGFKFDLRLALLLSLPLFLIGWIKWTSPYASKLHRRLWFVYFIIAQFVVILFYTTDFGYYAYLQMRLDATSLRFLENPLISAQMVWETYPVIFGIFILSVIVWIYARGLNSIVVRVTAQESVKWSKRNRLWFIPLTIFIYIFGLYGKFSFYPLRWSDAFFSPHPFASAIALNPVLYFFDTMKNKDSGYDINTAKQYYPVMADYLGLKNSTPDSLNYSRKIQSHKPVAKRPNVVIVLLESFASFKVGVAGNPLNPTPNFDQLAKSGIFYNRFYTPHTGTARSVFTMVTGIPDIELNKTSSRNPLIVKQHTIINSFKDYEKLYFLGGSANWGNIRGILSGNIPGLKMYEEGSYSDASPRIDVWGISDLHLFIEANQILRKQTDKPFFAIIQTSGNHRPYTIPEDNHGFNYDNQDIKLLKKYGFHSVGEFNSFRFMDHSIGKFIEAAQKEKYFENTIFAFFGDHGLGGQGTHIPKYVQQLNLHHVHVPFVIYAPGIIKQTETHSMVASEVDALPTLAGLALPEYTNTTFGRDLRDPQFEQDRYAFTITHSRNPEISLIGDQYLYRSFADGSQAHLFQLDAANPRQNVISQHPEIAKQYQQLCIGLHETAKYVRFNNAPATEH